MPRERRPKNQEAVDGEVSAESATPVDAPEGNDAQPALTLPAVSILDVVVLPQMMVPLHLDSWSQVRAVEMAMLGDRQVFLVPYTAADGAGQPAEGGPEAESLTPGRIGLIATVEESRPSRRGGQRVIVRGGQRASLDS